MKVSLESTTSIVDHKGNKARVWEGVTADGIKCYALIPLICHHKDDDHRSFEFQTSLQELKTPSQRAIEAFDIRLVT